MAPGEHVVAAHLPQHVLEQFEFIVHERIRRDEIVLAVCLVITEFRSLTSEFEHGAQVRVLLIPQLVHHRLIFRFLGQQALLNDLHHVGAVELQLDGEPALDLRKVIALLLGPITDDGIHVFLRGDHYPCTPVGLDGKILGNGLQGQHELPVLTDELANLVHEEQDTAVRFLMGQPCVHVVCEIADRHRIRILIALDDAVLLRLARHRGIGSADLIIP